MRPIDRIIVKVNDKVYSFLDPLLLDETERPYCSNDGTVNKLAVVIPCNKDFIILSLNGISVYSFVIESIQYDGVNTILKMICPL